VNVTGKTVTDRPAKSEQQAQWQRNSPTDTTLRQDQEQDKEQQW